MLLNPGCMAKDLCITRLGVALDLLYVHFKLKLENNNNNLWKVIYIRSLLVFQSIHVTVYYCTCEFCCMKLNWKKICLN